MSENPIPEPQNEGERRLEDLFVAWVGMGQGRNIAAVARNAGVPAPMLVAHAKKFQWPSRLNMVAAKAEEKTMEMMSETIAQVNIRHVTALRKLQEKAFNFLETAVIDKPADAIRLLMDATKLERDILGIKEQQNDVATVLATKLEKLKLIPADAEPEFEYQENLKVPELPAPQEEEK